MADWADLFDNFGVKIVSPTDKVKSAFVPTADQRKAMKAAGLEPSVGDEKAVHTIGVLFDPSVRSMKISYYNSERVGSGRKPEARIGQGLPRWTNVGDRIVIGNVGNRVFVAREPVPPPGEDFLTTEDGEILTTENGEPLTIDVEPDPDRFAGELEAGQPVLFGSPLELQRRREILARLDELHSELDSFGPQHGAIGHNKPPEDIDPEAGETELLAIVTNSADILRAELGKEEPDALEVARTGSLLRNLGHWLAGKFDIFAEEFAKGFGRTLGESLGKWVGRSLLILSISTAVGLWLEAITWPS